MKAAAVALVCVLRFAAQAQASEPARPSPPGPTAASLVGPLAGAPVIAKPGAPAPATFHIEPAPKPGDGAAAKEPQRDPAKPRAEAARRPRVCLGPTETRATVAAHRLAEPFRALRAGGQQGEALRAKLCRWKKDEFVYEISVLRRDGRILHLYMNAQSGQAVGALDDNDRH